MLFSVGLLFIFSQIAFGSEINVCGGSDWLGDVLNNEPITDFNQSQLIFSVRACENVRLLFYERNVQPSYELIIGRRQNNESRIKICVFEECSRICPDDTDDNCHMYAYSDADTADILDCNEFRWFWVSWNSNFCFGRGKEIGKRETNSANLVDIVINYITITVRQSVSWNTYEWIFDSESLLFTINEDLLCNKSNNSTPNFTGTTKTSGSNFEDTTTDLSSENFTESLTYSTTSKFTGTLTKTSGSNSEDTTTDLLSENFTENLTYSTTPKFAGTTKTSGSNFQYTTIDSSPENSIESVTYSTTTTTFAGTTKTSGINSEDITTDLSSENVTETLTYSTTTYGKITAGSNTTDDILKTTTMQTTNYNCMCPCSNVNNLNLTDDELLEFLTENLDALKQALQIDPKTTKAAQAKKICAPDDRNSSQIMGWVGSIIIGIGVGFLVLSDVSRFVHYLAK